MPSDVKLSEKEIEQIMVYNDSYGSYREISRRIKRSQILVSRFLDDPKNYGTKKHLERRPTLSNRERRIIIREFTKKEIYQNRFICVE